MWLLTLLIAILFGMSAYTAPAESVSRVTAVNTESPQPVAIDGEAATALAIEPVSGEMRFVATTRDLWSPGHGSEWLRAGVSPNHETIVVDSRDELLLWAGTPLDCYRGQETPKPMVQSTDGGATWEVAGPEGAAPLASWMNTGITVAHDCSGLLVSADAGTTWAVPEGYPMGSQVTAFAVESTPESAAGLSLLVGATSEGGTSSLYRVQVSGGEAAAVEGPLVSWYALGSVGVEHDGAILLGAPQGVLRSDDRGETWTAFRGGLESTTLEQDPLEAFPPDLEPGSFGLRTLLVTESDEFVTGVDGIYRWSDEQASWERLASLDTEVERLAIAAQGTLLFAQTVDGEMLQIVIE